MGRDAPDWDALPDPDAGGTSPPPSKIIIPMAVQSPGYFVTLEGKIYRPFMVDSSGRLLVAGVDPATGLPTPIPVIPGVGTPVVGKDPTGLPFPIQLTPTGCLRIGGLGDDGLWHCYATDKQGFFPIAAFRQPSGDLDGIVASPDGELVMAGKDYDGAYKALLSTQWGFLQTAPAYEAMGYDSYDSNPAPHAWTTRWTHTVPAKRYYVLQHMWVRVGLTTAANDAEARILVSLNPMLNVSSSINDWRSEAASPHMILEEGVTLAGQTRNADGVARQVSVSAIWSAYTHRL